MRSTFGHSKLVRQFGEWLPVDAEAPGMDFAERMSLWFSAFDAIRLQSVHQSVRAVDASAPRRGAAPRATTLAADLQRVRGALANAIAQDPRALYVAPLPSVETLRKRAKAPAADDADPGYAPYRQRHQELQRQMEMMIGPLREHVRQAVARASARLHQLATLDAALEQMLAPREQALLPTATTLLAQRFAQLREADGGRATFEQEWRQALLAELDLRLEPVAGLVDALAHESDTSP